MDEINDFDIDLIKEQKEKRDQKFVKNCETLANILVEFSLFLKNCKNKSGRTEFEYYKFIHQKITENLDKQLLLKVKKDDNKVKDSDLTDETMNLIVNLNKDMMQLLHYRSRRVQRVESANDEEYVLLSEWLRKIGVSYPKFKYYVDNDIIQIKKGETPRKTLISKREIEKYLQLKKR